MCHDFDLSISNLRNCHRVSEISDTILNLDLVVKEFLECGQIKNLIADGLGAIDGVLKLHISLDASIAVRRRMYLLGHLGRLAFL